MYAAYRLQSLERQKEWDEWDKWEEWDEWGALENGIAAKRHKMHKTENPLLRSFALFCGDPRTKGTDGMNGERRKMSLSTNMSRRRR
jgi:hypothetical protein